MLIEENVPKPGQFHGRGQTVGVYQFRKSFYTGFDGLVSAGRRCELLLVMGQWDPLISGLFGANIFGALIFITRAGARQTVGGVCRTLADLTPRPVRCHFLAILVRTRRAKTFFCSNDLVVGRLLEGAL